MAFKTKGSIYYNEGDLLEASINRSPTAYLQNPTQERSQSVDNFSEFEVSDPI